MHFAENFLQLRDFNLQNNTPYPLTPRFIVSKTGSSSFESFLLTCSAQQSATAMKNRLNFINTKQNVLRYSLHQKLEFTYSRNNKQYMHNLGSTIDLFLLLNLT